MELDARRLPDGTVLDADLCIVGAGPAGITLARELSGFGIGILLLESGGGDPDEWSQTLNDGAVDGDPYAGLRATRHRRVGGTTALWNTPVRGESGAKYVPLDAWDFDPPGNRSASGWPIARDALDPFYRRAQTVCGLGPFGYEGRHGLDPRGPPFDLSDESLCSGVYQFGGRRVFTAIYPGEFRESADVRLCVHATAGRLRAVGTGRISEASIGTRAGRWHTVRARTFVLAAGAVENARLLLLSGVGNERVGRYFMEHPRDHALTLLPAGPELFSRARFYDMHDAGAAVVGGRLGLSRRAVLELGHPNASVTLLPRLREEPARQGMARLARRLRDLVSPAPTGGYGWSTVRDPERFFDAFRLLVNFEQRPRPENRVTLGEPPDPLGLPRPVLHWRWQREEQAGLSRLRDFLKAALESAGLGRVVIDAGRPVDPNAHHHAGTTRMANDPKDGVVDPDCRVHGTRNLYVAGASVFPTAGFANPTLTVVALAIRLADHLKTCLPG